MYRKIIVYQDALLAIILYKIGKQGLLDISDPARIYLLPNFISDV